MEENKQLWMLDVLGSHNNKLYATLLYERELQSNNLKEVEFENTEKEALIFRGYFANKNRRKYWIDEEILKHLPIRIGEQNQELVNKEDVVIRPLNPTPFKITPEKKYSTKELIDNFAPFKHSNPLMWTLAKILAMSGFVCRTYVCISSESAFGKSSIYDLIHFLTDSSPVFKPRSVPGVLNHINGNGNMVFDETHRCKKEVRDIIEEFALQIGGGKTTYINGAMKSGGTKSKYDCTLQSITFLFNNTTNYENPLKDYFEFIFSNNKAINDRFLKVKLDGVLTEEFNKEFDIEGTAEANKMTYINYAKTLLFLQHQKQTNSYERRFKTNSSLRFKGRRRMGFNEVSWLIDSYCDNQEQYDLLIKTFEQSIVGYDEMVADLKQQALFGDNRVSEEYVE